MRPVLSFIAALAVLGAAFSLLHWISLALALPDLLALLLFALPVIAYMAYCTESTPVQVLRAAVRIYVTFAAVLLASAALVYFIG